MKRAGLALVVLMTIIISSAQETAIEGPLELELSRTLTLEPSGTAPVATAPATATPNPAILPSPTQLEPNSGASTLWKLGFAATLLMIPLAFGLGLRRDRSHVHAAKEQSAAANKQIATLKEALLESGSGARNEWQSSLTSMQAQLREKSSYIDRLHDQQSANKEQFVQFEKVVGTQSKQIESLNIEHELEREEQAKALQQQIDEQFEAAEQVASERDQATDSLKKLQEELDAVNTQHETLNAKFVSAQTELEQKHEHTQQLDQQITELESETKEIAQQLSQAKSNNAELTATLSQAQEQIGSLEQEKTKAQKNISDERQNFESALADQKGQFELTLEEEKKRYKTTLEKEQKQFKTTLEEERTRFEKTSAAEKATWTQSTQEKTNQLTTQIESLQQNIAASDEQFEALQSKLGERDHDLAAMIAQLQPLAATEKALEELRKTHTASLAELKTQTAQKTKIESELKVAKEELSQFADTRHELDKTTAEQSQMQSIIVETEIALEAARRALQDQRKQFKADLLEANETAKNSQLTAKQEIEQLNAQLEVITGRVDDESHRANAEQSSREELEQLFEQQKSQIDSIEVAMQSLESEHALQEEKTQKLNEQLEKKEAELEQQAIDYNQSVSELKSKHQQQIQQKTEIERKDLLDSHIEELEAQLKEEQLQRGQNDSQQSELSSNQKNKIDEISKRNTKLKKQLNAMRVKFETQQDSQTHLKKTLSQSRKYRSELEEHIQDLERENRELSESGTKSRQELDVSHQTLQTHAQKLSASEEELRQLNQKVDSQAQELLSLHDQLQNKESHIEEVDAALATAQSQKEQSQAESDEIRALKKALEKTQAELKQQQSLFADNDKHNEDHERNARALEEQLLQIQDEVKTRKERTTMLGAQLVELNEQREHLQSKVAALETQLEQPATSAKIDDRNTSSNQGKMIVAMEKQLQQSEKTIGGLRQQLDDLQLAGRAEARASESDGEPISSDDLAKLKKAYIEKSRQVQTLANEVKIKQDLVKVFENDSNLLHDTEIELESQQKNNQFLQHELAKAVTENKTLKDELDKAAKRIARQQNIGRNISEDKRIRQLMSRLDLLETENREQLEVIAQLRRLESDSG